MASPAPAPRMRVLAEEPWGWFLFEEDGQLYLDVLVEHGAISFTVTAELDAGQSEAFRRDGRAALALPAGVMRDKALRREWEIPVLPEGWSERAGVAVHAWKAGGGR